MAPLLSNVGRRNWNCRCCNPDKPAHGPIRAREKREADREARAGIDERGSDFDDYIRVRIGVRPNAYGRCPRDGLSCTCNDDRCWWG